MFSSFALLYITVLHYPVKSLELLVGKVVWLRMEAQLMSMLNYCLLMEIPLLLFSLRQMGATYSRILSQVRVSLSVHHRCPFFPLSLKLFWLCLYVVRSFLCCSIKWTFFQVSCDNHIYESVWLVAGKYTIRASHPGLQIEVRGSTEVSHPFGFAYFLFNISIYSFHDQPFCIWLKCTCLFLLPSFLFYPLCQYFGLEKNKSTFW